MPRHTAIHPTAIGRTAPLGPRRTTRASCTRPYASVKPPPKSPAQTIRLPVPASNQGPDAHPHETPVPNANGTSHSPLLATYGYPAHRVQFSAHPRHSSSLRIRTSTIAQRSGPRRPRSTTPLPSLPPTMEFYHAAASRGRSENGRECIANARTKIPLVLSGIGPRRRSHHPPWPSS